MPINIKKNKFKRKPKKFVKKTSKKLVSSAHKKTKRKTNIIKPSVDKMIEDFIKRIEAI